MMTIDDHTGLVLEGGGMRGGIYRRSIGLFYGS